MNAFLYINAPQTVTIATSPSQRVFRTMANNGTATKTATQERLYRIGEVSRLADLKPFVLRYWETEFPMLEPVKSSGGRRLYRQEDVDLVFRIKRLLYDEGFTIAGARRHLREHNGPTEWESRSPNHAADGSAQLLSRKMLLDLRDTLRAFLTLLERR
ncbi:MAG TPA: MerR family transcriptional regulator [Candidatus Acidoferrum sp.]|nr:MerR family transcriptional regulator [Candidatus Acidoferrum sp.]